MNRRNWLYGISALITAPLLARSQANAAGTFPLSKA